MTTTLFDGGWSFHREDGIGVPINLPHDAMIGEPREADAPSGSHGAYFPGGRYVYRKSWNATSAAPGEQTSLLFEGVYGATRVVLDGVAISEWNSGYREVTVPLGELAPGEHQIEVQVDNTRQPNARWYTGSGIYRSVWLKSTPVTAIACDEISATTSLRGPNASVSVVVPVDGAQPSSTYEVDVRLLFDDVLVASGTAPVREGVSPITLDVARPKLWSSETPNLHRAVIELRRGAEVVDQFVAAVGLRTIHVDADHGLRINGTPTLLRGACVHHDNGLLGAATYRAAEYRRVRLLKEAGYNAVRSSHNPISRAFLDACDYYGMYVIDELTDVWFASKTTFDAADQFESTWPDDATSMVRKDRLHPSVIMYSIGNENAETGTERGIEATRAIRRHLRELDSERPVTVGMNFMLNAVAARPTANPVSHEASPQPKKSRTPGSEASLATSTAINVLANRMGALTRFLSRIPRADATTRGALELVDIAGYNYAWSRYASDTRRHPHRVILGTESLAGDLPRIWPLVQRHPQIIGDFVWTGWDYLGEAGIGSWQYDAARRSSLLAKPFPHLIAGSGAIDITGLPGAPVALQRAVWGLARTPSIMVRPLDRSGAKVQRTVWRSTDALSSWSWYGFEGRIAEIEVYSDADRVELYLNGRLRGTKRAGRRAGYVSRFSLPYQPGELTAVAYRGDVEVGRSALRTAQSARLSLRVEEQGCPPGRDELAFVWIELADADGTVDSAASARVSLRLDGPAQLVAFGSARPATTERFTSTTRSTFYGRALAVIRSFGEGEITVGADAPGHTRSSLRLFPGHSSSDGRLAP